jgi:hypothetical protein
MPFTAEQLERLTGIISEYVPLGIVLDLPHPRAALPLDDWRKKFVADYRGFSRQLVDAYHRRNMIPLLACALYRRFYRDDLVATKFVEFCKDPANKDITYQAAFVLRANMLSAAKLRHFIAEVEPRMCVVLADAGPMGLRRGTGFLIGPDLIITAYHTLQYHLHDDEMIVDPPGNCLAVFDHLYGDPIDTVDPDDPNLRRIPFAKEWLVKSGNKKNIDYALVKLAEKIGDESYAANGGRRRHWFSYAECKLGLDERIIIPQHPDGSNLQQDFGRYVESDDAEIHIRYTTETFPGSSGAPCFDGRHRLVGMHHGVYKPNDVEVLNQAIRFDHIAREIEDDLKTSCQESERAELWSVTSSPQPPRPILGRKALIDWINSGEAPASKAGSRILVVEAMAPYAGRGFTIEILKAARRESQDPVVVLGNERGADGRRQPLPQLADDALRIILQQLPFAVRSDPFPPRPGIGTPGESKLEKWVSDDLLRALDETLASNRQRTVDERSVAAETARQIKALVQDARSQPQGETDEKHVALVEEQGLKLEASAQQGEAQPLSQTRWERIWIAVIMTKDTHLSKEMVELLAGLAKATNDELARLRILLIGEVPQSLKSLSLNTTEVLDPASIGIGDYSRCVQQIASSLGRHPTLEFINGIVAGSNDFIDASRTMPDRLSYLQGALARVSINRKLWESLQ